MKSFRTRGAAASILCLSLLLGCGGVDGPPLATVTGTVTLDGKPVKGALLEFVPQQPGGSTAWGGTDENGQYEMLFGQSREGAVVGRSLVRITSDDRVSVGGQAYERTEVFPPRYNTQSDQYVDVVDGENVFDFKCESGEFQPRQPRGSSGGN